MLRYCERYWAAVARACQAKVKTTCLIGFSNPVVLENVIPPNLCTIIVVILPAVPEEYNTMPKCPITIIKQRCQLVRLDLEI